MGNPQEPSAQPGASRPKRIPSALQTGLLAVQKKQYREAIALLQGIAQGSWDAETLAKARMGLVKAYAGLGRTEEAIALCEELTAVPIPSVFQWANETLRQLQKITRQEKNATSSPTPSHEADLAAGLTTIRPPTQPPSQPAASAKAVPSSPPTPAAPATPTPSRKTSSPSPHRPQPRGSLGNLDVARLWALEAVTLAGLIMVPLGLAYGVRQAYNTLVLSIAFPKFTLGHWAFYGDPRWVVLPLVAIALLGSVWLLRLQLKHTKGLQPLSFDALKQYSPGAAQVLQTFARQRRSLSPKLACLPDKLPFALTFGGVFPKQAQLVVSRGLLEQLDDDEIAAVIGAELAHLRFRDAAVLSGLVTLAQIPFGLYWVAAQWGDKRSSPLLKVPATFLSVVSYGIFRSIRLVGLWLSRMRLFYSDRIATELTGNPNALSRALVKLAIATAQEVEHQGQTPAFLEQFDLLFPVGIRESLAFGSLYAQSPGLNLLEWDYHNPFRRWLSIRDSHPPLGDRLATLARYAQRWRIPPDFDLDLPTHKARPTRSQEWRMILQSLPALGALLGLAIGQGFWWFGMLADRMGWLSLDWFQSSFIHSVSLWIGFSTGTFLRINPFFPEIRRPNDVPQRPLPDLLSRPDALPVDGPATRLQGILLGRCGIANAIGQDLLLKTDTGLLRLHFLPTLSFQHNPITGWRQLQNFLHRPVLATGWFRRGATPWLDLDVLQSQSSRPLRGGHPLWSTVLALVLVLWSCYTIVTGEL